MTYVGRDYYRHEVAATLPRIEVELGIRAEPLARLFHNHETVEGWLRKRKAHLEKTLIPEPPASDGRPDFMRPFMYAADFGGERAEFRRRLDDHLDACRNRLVDNVLEWIIDGGINAVSFVVENPAEDPIAGLRVMATFAVGDAHVLADSPDAQPMPQPPKWPDQLEMMRGGFNPADMISSMAWLPARPARPGSPRIEITDGFAQINCAVGDLLAFEKLATQPIFIIPQVDFEVEELEITVTARAKTRKGVKTEIFKAPIREEGFLLEKVIDPTY
jgi:hypothetical protein